MTRATKVKTQVTARRALFHGAGLGTNEQGQSSWVVFLTVLPVELTGELLPQAFSMDLHDTRQLYEALGSLLYSGDLAPGGQEVN